MERYGLALVLVFVLVIGCKAGEEVVVEEAGLELSLQNLVDEVVAETDGIHGAALWVEAPGLRWRGAAGLADPEGGVTMTPETPVRIASNTKTYTAATVLRLWEKGLIDLDGSVDLYLPDELVDLLRSDGYQVEEMTVRHLLTHTSGLFDHSEPASYGEAIAADPQHPWTRLEQVSLAMASGDPHAPPGEIYTYCDTGYVLLGGLVEQVYGKPLAVAARELLGYSNLALNSTWWETVETPPDGVPERAHQFLGEVDTHGFYPAFDLYGGGGLVATVGDMARFFRALFTDGVFDRPETSGTMLTTLDGVRARSDAEDSALPPGAYRMGVWVTDVESVETYRHTGFWGTLATYVPELDLTVACTVNQNQGKEAMLDLTRDTIALVRNAR